MTRVVARVIISGLGHYQSALGTHRCLLILKADSAPCTVQVQGPGVLVPLDVGGWAGEELDGAGEGDGAARLHKHGRLSVNNCRRSYKWEQKDKKRIAIVFQFAV